MAGGTHKMAAKIPNTLLIGAQWGDEGKGKIVDVLSREADVVIRYQGGSNAGHTIEVGTERYVLHLVPSGILHPNKICVIGNGMVVDPLALVAELRELAGRGISADGRLFVSDRAHLVLPWHKLLDAAREQGAETGVRIGTTQRGIGPAYADKAARLNLRMGDLVDGAMPALLSQHLEARCREMERSGVPTPEPTRILEELAQAAEFLRPFVTDTVTLLQQAYRAGRSLLFEGAQGVMLDLDFGTYPYVTSSNPSCGGVCTGTGLPARAIERVLGVLKAYTTRVGAGPFPTELQDAVGTHLRERGGEFGATTGRPRRCGWFDAVVARYAAMLNGVDYWAVTKLDVLDTLETVRICVAYECDGRRYETVPARARDLARCVPVYEELPGWRTATTGISRFAELPPAARAYLDRLCELTGVPLGLLSFGPRRETTFRLGI